ncbi:hypothetical protein HOS16_gp49 [Shigella phage vB_SflS-ISF001]|uniref:Uncharacterized protein n=1 Tax=Shigella phage vB_SflS-ISF001 TaxID=2048005 RepID=A0A2D1GQ30_9CAUD|nr:hypothetical protein HOS16_gp49 [Shigella phage vB_SflS-ISF001]ATN94127.1 hypothetical protein FLXISF001_049 [Shigella phage vB_SflS-ISF001]
MMVSVDKFFTCNKSSEVFERVHTDNADFMHDGCDVFIEVKDSDYDDWVYYNLAVYTQSFTPIADEAEEA